MTVTDLAVDSVPDTAADMVADTTDTTPDTMADTAPDGTPDTAVEDTTPDVADVVGPDDSALDDVDGTADTDAELADQVIDDTTPDSADQEVGDASEDVEVVAPIATSFLAWNQAALQAVTTQTMMMPPQESRMLAMLHIAMYDAVNSVEQLGQPFLYATPAPAGASAEAAAIQAAAVILKAAFPTQVDTLEALRVASLLDVPDGQSEADGIAAGEAAAVAVMGWRSMDGSTMMMGPPYTGGTDPGQWRPTPPSFQPGAFAMWSMVTPFAMTSHFQFRPPAPPALDSLEYALDYNETKDIGSLASATRTMDQGMMASFWVGMPGTIMEVGRMNLVVQQAAEAHDLSLFELARLFAMVNVAMADGAIAGLDCKYTYSAWRPVTAIRDGELDNNLDTAGDLTWEPYLATPAHPEYPSTHSVLTRAAAEVLAQYFGDDTATLTLPSFMDPSLTRSYTSYSQVAEEAGLGRIYGGIHFRFSYDTGISMGQQIGQYVVTNSFNLL